MIFIYLVRLRRLAIPRSCVRGWSDVMMWEDDLVLPQPDDDDNNNNVDLSALISSLTRFLVFIRVVRATTQIHCRPVTSSKLRRRDNLLRFFAAAAAVALCLPNGFILSFGIFVLLADYDCLRNTTCEVYCSKRGTAAIKISHRELSCTWWWCCFFIYGF